MIDVKWRTFLTVIEEGTLAKAGDKLGLTQPAVSQHLKALELYYGQPLFNHKGRRLVLNDAGSLVETTANKILLMEKRLEGNLKGFLSGQSHFKIGATLTVGEFILPSYLGRYKKTFPKRELLIQINNTVTILDQLKKGLIDLAVIEGPFDKSSVEYKLFMKDEMIFIGTESYLEKKHIVDQTILDKSRLILREQGSGTRFYWEEYKRNNNLLNITTAPIMEVGSLSAIKSLVEAGYGCSIMSKKAVEKELLWGSIVTKPFLWGPLIRELNFVYTKDSPVKFIDEFINWAMT